MKPGRQRGLLARVFVVARRERRIPLVAEVIGQRAEHRPGEVVLAVREECPLRVLEREVGREAGGGARRLVHAIHTGERVDHVAGADVAVRLQKIRARDPAQLVRHVGRIAKLLARRAHAQVLALVPVAVQRPVDVRGQARRREERTENQLVEVLRFRSKVEGVAGQYLAGGIVRSDRSERAAGALDIPLHRELVRILDAFARIVHADRHARIVRVVVRAVDVDSARRRRRQAVVVVDHEVERGGVDVRHRVAEVAGHVVGRLPGEAHASREVLERIGLVVEEGIVQVAVRVAVRKRRAVFPLVAHRAAHGALHGITRSRVVTGAYPGLELIGGLLRHDVDRTADRVAAVKSALRALEHLDLLDVVELLVELRRVRHEHAIDDDRNGHVAVACLRDAANGDERVAGILGLHDRHVRRELDEVVHSLDARRVDLERGEGFDRRRSVRIGFRPEASGDDDLLELGLLREGRRDDERRQQ